MKVRFKTCFRLWMALLLIAAGWSLVAGAQTASNKPALTNTPVPKAAVSRFDRLEPKNVTFGLDRVPALRDNRFLGEPLWKYAASILYVIAAFLLARLVDIVLFVWLRKLAARTRTELDDLLLAVLHGPIKVLLFVLFLQIGLEVFNWSAKAHLYLSKTFVVVVAGALTYLTLRVSGLLLDVWKKRHYHEADRKFNDQLFSVIRRGLNIFIIIVAVLVTASNLGVNITAAITSLSIGGLAVGLAAQDTLANLFGAVAVFADKPFRVGDRIKLDAAEGMVEFVGMRSTRVRGSDGSVVTVPNKIMGSAAITNLSKRQNIKTTINFALARDTSPEKIERAVALLKAIYGGNPMTEQAWVNFNQFAGANINVQVVHWWKGTDELKYLEGMQALNLAVKGRLETEGIKFA